MRKTMVLTIVSAALAASSAAQTALPPRTLQLTVDGAVKMALDNNVDLRADRLDPQISDTRVAAAAGAFRPTITSSVQRNSQLQPPTNFLIPTPTSTAAVTSSVGFNQRLSQFGTSYNVAWSATHTDSNSVLNSFNPVLQSGLSLGVSQPLLRDFGIDGSRQQLATSRINRDIADTRLRESLVHTTASVKTAYWNLASAIANVEARRSALALAEELTRVNRAKVDVGQSPALDLLSAQAEVAANQEQLIIAETAVKQAEDRLRLLIFDPTDREIWNVRLEPVDSPPVGTMAPDLDAAVTTALKDRADLLRARKDIDTSATNVRYANNQRLPDVRASVSYTASGLGGTQVLRAVPFGPVTSTGAVTGLGDVLSQIGRLDYPTWVVGVSLSYPIGQTSDQAAYTRARIESAQADERLKGAEARAIQQVRDAGWKIEMNAKRVETTRVARDLAEQRLDAERKRFEVGMSTSFLVVQAQRDLAQAKQNELAAVLAYDLSLVDFEALQQAGPAGSGGTASGSGAGSGAQATGAAAAAGSAAVQIPGFGN